MLTGQIVSNRKNKIKAVRKHFFLTFMLLFDWEVVQSMKMQNKCILVGVTDCTKKTSCFKRASNTKFIKLCGFDVCICSSCFRLISKS